MTDGAVAIYAYKTTEAGHLSFDEKEKIIVLEKHDGGWWLGKKTTKEGECTGYFPASYVGLETEEERGEDVEEDGGGSAKLQKTKRRASLRGLHKISPKLVGEFRKHA